MNHSAGAHGSSTTANNIAHGSNRTYSSSVSSHFQSRPATVKPTPKSILPLNRTEQHVNANTHLRAYHPPVIHNRGYNHYRHPYHRDVGFNSAVPSECLLYTNCAVNNPSPRDCRQCVYGQGGTTICANGLC